MQLFQTAFIAVLLRTAEIRHQKPSRPMYIRIMVRIFLTDTEALALPLQSNFSLSTANDASNISPPQGVNSTRTVVGTSTSCPLHKGRKTPKRQQRLSAVVEKEVKKINKR